MGQDRESLIRTNASNNALIEISKNSEAYKNQQDDFTGGWRRAFETYVADLGNANKQAARLFDSFTTTVDSAIDQFVTKGKVSFSDLIKSMIQDLEKFLLKQAAMNLFKASGAGDIFSTAASAGSAEGPLTGLLSGAAKFFGFKAQGGDIPAGGYAMVGEAGPELVRGPASVTSARDTGMMGSGVTNNNYTIQAVDAKSVAQLFYENRMTMFGMTEQARRELPMRNR